MATYPNPVIDDIREDFTKDRNTELKLVRQYAQGEHTNTMTPAQRRLLFPQKIQRQSDNVVGLILKASASRVRFTGWDVSEPRPERGDDAGDIAEDLNAPGPVQSFLAEIDMRNRLRKLQYRIHYGMYRDGNYAVSLGWRDDRGRVYREAWWDGEEGIFVGYDRYGEEEFAVKEWIERDPVTPKKSQRRRTVYYADHFIRYWQNGSTWEPIRELDPEETARLEAAGRSGSTLPDGAVPWEKAAGDPLGLPVIHFANDSRDDTPYGVSEIADLLGLQDQLNANQDDISGASRFTGFQMIAIFGHQTAEGQKIIVGPGRVLEFADPAADAKVLPAGDMTNLTTAHSYKRSTMAINSNTPLHLIEGKQWPSGEAILQAQMPAIDKAETSIEVLGPNWSTIGHRLTEMANAFGNAGLDEDAPITALFDDPRRLDEMTEVRIQHERAKMMETVGRIADPILIEKLDLMTKAEFESFMANRNGEPDPNAPAPPVREDDELEQLPPNVVGMF